MSFSTSNENSDRLFNNADNFAMVFDEAWRSLQFEKDNNEFSTEDKLKMVLEKIKDHPFLIDSPSVAQEVAQFRIRLLNLL
ncbi:MAG TPA: hypothetical protein ACN46Y_04340 [Prochlorococcus sp.]